MFDFTIVKKRRRKKKLLVVQPPTFGGFSSPLDQTVQRAENAASRTTAAQPNLDF
jgi:hypothetical protein